MTKATGMSAIDSVFLGAILSSVQHQLLQQHDGKAGFAVLAGGRLSDATLDCKSSATQLFMPAPVAVAHGDANLAIDDFLKSVS